jgi:hypothetical protein
MKKFAYLFTLGGKIVISRDNLIELQRRVRNEPGDVQAEVADFIKNSSPGDDMQLPTGEFIFCVSDS